MLIMVERQPSLLIPPHNPVDTAQWEVYEACTKSAPVYDRLLPPAASLAAAKEEFFASGRTAIPDLRPPEPAAEQVAAEERRLLGIKQSLLAADGPDWLRQAYRWRINEDIANLRMLRDARAGRRFAHYNQFVYGQPDERIYVDTVDWFRQQANEATDSSAASVRQAADDVLAALPDQGGKRSGLLPDPEVFEAIRRQHFQDGGYYTLLLAGVSLPPTGKVPREIGDTALQTVLDNLHSDYAIADAAGSTWSVAHATGQVKRPANYNMVRQRFIGLGLGHEIGSHLLEYVNGQRSGLRLLSSGLDRYEQANEGRAVIREQVVYESFADFAKLVRWQDILRRHFAISLAEGLAGDKLAFPDVFKLVNDVDRLWERQKLPDDPAAADAKADKRTWDLLTRVLKGTDGQGGAYRKDIVYLEGNLACWQLAKRHPELIALGDLGKFNIADPRHIALLQTAGVLPREGDDDPR